jgi:hypothetical protein
MEIKNLECWYEGEFYVEEWKPIEGFPQYQISSFGRIKSARCPRIKLLTLSKGGKRQKPYYRLRLISLIGEKERFMVHRLVALHFISNPEHKPFVNHKDFDRFNNFFKNLEWNTGTENTHHYHNSKSKSGVIGVTWQNQSKKFRSVFHYLGVRYLVGEYKNIESAKLALNNKKKELGIKL